MIVWIIILTFLAVTYFLAKRDLLWAVGWLLFLVPAYLLRVSIFGLPSNALELGIYVVFGAWLIKLLRKKSRMRWNNFNWLIVLLLVVSLLTSWLVSADKKMSLGLWKGWLIDPFLIYLVVSSEFKRQAQIVWIRSGFLFLVAMLSLVGVWQLLIGNIDMVDGRLAVFFSSANYLAMLLVPALLFLLASFWQRNKLIWWEMVIFILGVGVLIATGSYISLGAFLLAAGWLGLMAWRKSGNWMLGVILVGMLIAGIFLATQWGTERMNNMLDLSRRSSITVRLQVWQTAWSLIGEYPVWGIGLGNFEQKYFDKIGSVLVDPLEWRMLHAHNFWLQTWLTLSVFGLIIFAWIVIYTWWLGLKIWKSKDGKKWYIGGLLAMLLSFVLTGILDTPYYKNDFSFIFWLMVGLLVAAKEILIGDKKRARKKV